MKDKYNREITYMRLSVTDRCNLRCEYCMPEEGISKKQHQDMLSIEEMIMSVEAAAQLGVKKIRITGGEPLVKRGIIDLCNSISQIPGIEEIGITTNGIRMPEYADELKAAGVTRINFSLDTLDPIKYHSITRMGDLAEALTGLKAAYQAGFKKIKINTVLMGGFNDDEIRDFVELTEEFPIEVRFIELMPIGEGIKFNRAKFVSCNQVLKEVPELEPLQIEEGVAKLYQLPGAVGRVGLISPISCDFCHRCDKIRLTADGKLKPCLHSNQEINLKGMGSEQMRHAIEQAIMDKPLQREELSTENPSKAGRDMNQIGG